MVKHLLELKDDSNDYDRNMNVDDLINEVRKKLIFNKILEIPEDSTLIENLNEYILPYYKDIYMQCIDSLNKLILNYDRFIINNYRNLDIVNLFLNKIVNTANAKYEL